MTRELLKQVLVALEMTTPPQYALYQVIDTVNAIRAHLDNTKDVEPVAWINDKLPHMTVRIKPHENGGWVPVFLHPKGE
jgi:hypothetical protein